MPPNGDEIMREGDFRTKTRLLNDFSQLHVIDNFHGQAAVRAAALVGGPFEELECTYACVSAGMWIVDAE